MSELSLPLEEWETAALASLARSWQTTPESAAERALRPFLRARVERVFQDLTGGWEPRPRASIEERLVWLLGE